MFLVRVVLMGVVNALMIWVVVVILGNDGTAAVQANLWAYPLVLGSLLITAIVVWTGSVSDQTENRRTPVAGLIARAEYSGLAVAMSIIALAAMMMVVERFEQYKLEIDPRFGDPTSFWTWWSGTDEPWFMGMFVALGVVTLGGAMLTSARGWAKAGPMPVLTKTQKRHLWPSLSVLFLSGRLGWAWWFFVNDEVGFDEAYLHRAFVLWLWYTSVYLVAWAVVLIRRRLNCRLAPMEMMHPSAGFSPRGMDRQSQYGRH